MKIIRLHTRNTAIVYKNALCSSASIVVMVFIVLSVMVPVLLVSLLSPYSGIAESRVLFEQPRLQFKFQHLFVAEATTTSIDSDTLAVDLLVCSTFPNFNARLANYSKACEGTKYWTVDLDHDNVIDRVHFQLQLSKLPGRIQSFDLALFFAASLKHKCPLSPPSVLTHRLSVPTSAQLHSGTILLKGELQLKQYVEFTCPFPGRTSKTHFRETLLHSANAASDDMQPFQIESLLQELKSNPAYFELNVHETYYRRHPSEGVRIELEIDVLQVPARYHLSVWERLGQFWLYFASFFGISFYVMNKLKDFLFSRHIIRSWEIVPWKKLY